VFFFLLSFYFPAFFLLGFYANVRCPTQNKNQEEEGRARQGK